MEETHRSHAFLSVLIIFLSSFILLSHSLAPPGTIQRTTKQQLLASLPPSDHDTASSQLFLISPSGKYRVYLLRRETSLGAGGFGNDFCYLQVQDSAAGVSVWESDCTSVSNVNTCTLLFSEAGLEIFDGSQSAWDNDVDGENLETLVLMDSGDMQIRDKDGDVVWKASDNPVVNQNCGSIGAPGLAPDHPTFGSPIHDDSTGPFGQPAVDSPVQQPHHDQLGVQQLPHQLGNSSPGPEEENQPQQVLTASPGEQEPVASSVEENNQLPQEPAASPEEENNQLPQEPAASPEEENNRLPQEPAASPEEENNRLPQEPAASPEKENNRLPQEPAASPEEENQTPQEPAATPEEEHQPQQEPAASPEAEHHHHQRQPGSPEEGGLSNNPSSSLGHHPVGARNQPTTYLNQQQQPIPVGVAAHQQPLIDNIPFDSGSSREKPSKFRVTLVFLLTTLIVYNLFLLG